MALAQALAREFDAVGVVNDTVEDGVGERGVRPAGEHGADQAFGVGSISGLTPTEAV